MKNFFFILVSLFFCLNVYAADESEKVKTEIFTSYQKAHPNAEVTFNYFKYKRTFWGTSEYECEIRITTEDRIITRALRIMDARSSGGRITTPVMSESNKSIEKKELRFSTYEQFILEYIKYLKKDLDQTVVGDPQLSDKAEKLYYTSSKIKYFPNSNQLQQLTPELIQSTCETETQLISKSTETYYRHKSYLEGMIGIARGGKFDHEKMWTQVGHLQGVEKDLKRESSFQQEFAQFVCNFNKIEPIEK